MATGDTERPLVRQLNVKEGLVPSSMQFAQREHYDEFLNELYASAAPGGIVPGRAALAEADGDYRRHQGGTASGRLRRGLATRVSRGLPLGTLEDALPDVNQSRSGTREEGGCGPLVPAPPPRAKSPPRTAPSGAALQPHAPHGQGDTAGRRGGRRRTGGGSYTSRTVVLSTRRRFGRPRDPTDDSYPPLSAFSLVIGPGASHSGMPGPAAGGWPTHQSSPSRRAWWRRSFSSSQPVKRPAGSPAIDPAALQAVVGAAPVSSTRRSHHR
eukprot:TRINITY_DN16882_c0_g1_i1.p1 TRINITY_DN16882_c0_g1~~TRINITY_DN16882_c0_g1_i1.p1  ORF type:complete len:298 (+),score=61.98 TRINITY_DN16882_c0_g1_i1:88-894(+)